MKKIILMLLTLLCVATCACRPTDVPDTTDPPPKDTQTETDAPTETESGDIPVVENDKNIIISIFWEPPAEFTNAEHYDLIKNAGINHIEITNRESWQVDGNVDKILELCEERGITVTYHTAQTDKFINMQPSAVKRFVEQFKDSKTVTGFYVVDEPGNPTAYATVYKSIVEAMPNALPGFNFLPYFATIAFENYNGHIEDFIAAVGAENMKEISYDQYPFPDNNARPQMFYNLDLFRKLGLKYNIDTAFYIQSIGEKGNFRRTNAGEIRYHVSAGLAYGIKHYKYFTWWTTGFCEEEYYAIISPYGEVTDIYDGVKDVNESVARVGNILANCDALEVYHSRRGDQDIEVLPKDSVITTSSTSSPGYIVSFMQHRLTGRDYIMLVNKDYNKDKTAAFDIKGIKELFDVTSGEYLPLDITSGSINIDFKPGGFVLLAVGKDDDIVSVTYDESDNLAKGKPVAVSKVNPGNGYYAYTVTDGKRDSSDATACGWRLDGEGTITVDLKRSVSFDRIDMYPVGTDYTLGDKFPKDFTVNVSEDGINFKTVADSTGCKATESIPVLNFDAVSARYVRFDIKDKSLTEIAEIEIYSNGKNVPAPDNSRYKTAGGEPSGTNIALGKPVFVSSSLERKDWGWSSDYLTDGKLMGNAYGGWTSMTGQHSNADAEEWLTVDLCAVYQLDKLELYPRQSGDGSYFPEEYLVLISDDGENFTEAAHITELHKTNDPSVVDLTGKSGRYVKVLTLKMTMPVPNDGYLFQVSEVKIFNK